MANTAFRTPNFSTVRLKRTFRDFLDVFPIPSYPSCRISSVVKFCLKQICILPYGRPPSDDVAVTRPGILLKFGNGSYESRTNRIEMDVPDDITEIPVLANHG
jgi:hypothetical protein